LPAHVDLALILNPALTAQELLHAACDELGIQIAEGENSTKVLVDRLNAYLLEAHARGRRPVLMIDEAQNLAPEVLEQIRLLTNLETAKHKLLQIFLVGQPELRELLQRRELRQLAQRITARYHLLPLDAQETGAYIHHRLTVAGADRTMFSAAAVRRIYRFTGGVPRLINILCERALLGAYATHAVQVDRAIVSRAWRELDALPSNRPRRLAAAVTATVLALGAGGGWLAYSRLYSAAPEPAIETPPMAPVVTVEPASSTDTKPVEEPIAAPAPLAPPVAGAMAEPSIEPRTDHFILSEGQANTLLFQQWALTLPTGSQATPCHHARALQLRCKGGRGDWDALRRYDRPAVLPLTRMDGTRGHVLLIGLSDDQALLAYEDGKQTVALAHLSDLWDGDYLLLWRPAPGDRSLIGPNSPDTTVQWLRQTLGSLPGAEPLSGTGEGYDAALHNAVERFQQAQGLKVDGIVGPQTLIRLNGVAGLPDIPHLRNSF